MRSALCCTKARTHRAANRYRVKAPRYVCGQKVWLSNLPIQESSRKLMPRLLGPLLLWKFSVRLRSNKLSHQLRCVHLSFTCPASNLLSAYCASCPLSDYCVSCVGCGLSTCRNTLEISPCLVSPGGAVCFWFSLCPVAASSEPSSTSSLKTGVPWTRPPTVLFCFFIQFCVYIRQTALFLHLH